MGKIEYMYCLEQVVNVLFIANKILRIGLVRLINNEHIRIDVIVCRWVKSFWCSILFYRWSHNISFPRGLRRMSHQNATVKHVFDVVFIAWCCVPTDVRVPGVYRKIGPLSVYSSYKNLVNWKLLWLQENNCMTITTPWSPMYNLVKPFLAMPLTLFSFVPCHNIFSIGSDVSLFLANHRSFVWYRSYKYMWCSFFIFKIHIRNTYYL